MKVINLFGGPGSGKSTMAAGLFYEMKQKGLNVELVTEYAKDKVWEDSLRLLNNQIYVFGKQLHRLWRLNTKVEYIVTDSPILLSIIYDSEHNTIFRELVIQEFNKFDNINFFINRTKSYVESGRLQTKEQAIEIDNKIMNLLDEYNINRTLVEINDISNILTKI